MTMIAVSAPSRVSSPGPTALEPIAIHDNRTPAGTLGGGTLNLRLELREGLWHPDRDTDPGLAVRAFAEEGKAAVVPGPLIRVREGTMIHASVRNTLRDSTLILHGLSSRGVTHTYHPNMIARLVRDSTLLAWRAIAKDGSDLPAERATTRPAAQQMGNGETYDFEFVPNAPGNLRLTVSSGVGVVLASMPIRVR